MGSTAQFFLLNRILSNKRRCGRNHPLAHPSKTQQSIRVIREEVARIEWALKEILPG